MDGQRTQRTWIPEFDSDVRSELIVAYDLLMQRTRIVIPSNYDHRETIFEKIHDGHDEL